MLLEKLARIAVFIVLTLNVASCGSSGVPLWKSANIGMTPEQVADTMEGSHLLVEGHYAAPNHPSGLLPKVQLDYIPIGEHKFQGTFFFNKENGLASVILRINLTHGMQSQTEGRLFYQDIVAELKAKYGEPIDESHEVSGLNKYATRWISGSVECNATLVTMGDKIVKLTVRYDARDSVNGANL